MMTVLLPPCLLYLLNQAIALLLVVQDRTSDCERTITAANAAAVCAVGGGLDISSYTGLQFPTSRTSDSLLSLTVASVQVRELPKLHDVRAFPQSVTSCAWLCETIFCIPFPLLCARMLSLPVLLCCLWLVVACRVPTLQQACKGAAGQASEDYPTAAPPGTTTKGFHQL